MTWGHSDPAIELAGLDAVRLYQFEEFGPADPEIRRGVLRRQREGFGFHDGTSRVGKPVLRGRYRSGGVAKGPVAVWTRPRDGRML